MLVLYVGLSVYLFFKSKILFAMLCSLFGIGLVISMATGIILVLAAVPWLAVCGFKLRQKWEEDKHEKVVIVAEMVSVLVCVVGVVVVR